MDRSDKKGFYVYALLDPRKRGIFRYDSYEFNCEPFYIGKGLGSRAHDHVYGHPRDRNHAKMNKIKNIKRATGEPYVINIVSRNISEKEAFALEKYLIGIIAGNDLRNSPLTNLTYGGGPGARWSLESREKASEAQKERFKSDTEREKARQTHIKWIDEHPEEHRKNTEKQKKTQRRNQHRKRISQKMKAVYERDRSIVELQRLSRIKTYEIRPEIAKKISRSLGGSPIEVYRDGQKIDIFDTQQSCIRTMGFSPCFVTKRLHGGGRGKNGYEIRFANS
jgi:hypothetical protein